MEKRWWTSSCGRIELWMSLEQAQSVSHPGECDKDVKFLSDTSNIKAQIAEIDSDVLKDVLSQYGCWDDEQLKDTYQNIQRLLWIAGGDIADNEEE